MADTIRSMPDNFTAERQDLAAAFRLAVRHNFHESVANHFSLAVSEDGRRFLMNPNCMHFSRIKASDLMLLDADDPDVMTREDAPDPTAWDIHGAIHRRNPNATCVMHVHSKYATVLATLKDPTLPPIDQNTMRFYGDVAVDSNFGGMGLGEEAERMVSCLGDKSVMIMGNHGVMVVGDTVARAFDNLYYFERAAETYITALMTGRELAVASDAVARQTFQDWKVEGNIADRHFAELRAILDVEEPDYKD